MARGALLALLTLAACRSQRPAGEERVARARAGTGDIVIGVPFPWAAYSEVRYGEGLQMAVDETNASGGVRGRRVRLLREDDHGSVDEGRVVAQRLAGNPDVLAVIGHLQSFVSVPAAAIYDLAGVVMLSPMATDPALTSQGYRQVFSGTMSERAMGRSLAEDAAARGYRRVAICYIRNRYGRGLANAFEERAGEIGVTIAARQSYDVTSGGGDSDARAFEPTLREWQRMQFDAIFLAGEVPSATQFLVAARAVGITVPVIGGEAMSSPALLQAGAAAEGTIVAGMFHPDEPRPAVQRFSASFTRRFGVPPDGGSAVGYDAVHVLVNAMRRAPSLVPADIATALHQTPAWEGVTGTYRFDRDGNLVDKQFVTMVVRRGRFEYLPRGVGGTVPAIASATTTTAAAAASPASPMP